MAITLKGITTAARCGLPIALLADCAIASPYLEGAQTTVTQFALSYVTALLMLLAFHRRSAAVLAIVTAIILSLIWSLNTVDSDMLRLSSAVMGALCGLVPACLRDLQRLASSEEYMDITQLRTLQRRRDDAPYRPMDRRASDRAPVGTVMAALPDLRPRRDDGEI